MLTLLLWVWLKRAGDGAIYHQWQLQLPHFLSIGIVGAETKWQCIFDKKVRSIPLPGPKHSTLVVASSHSLAWKSPSCKWSTSPHYSKLDSMFVINIQNVATGTLQSKYNDSISWANWQTCKRACWKDRAQRSNELYGKDKDKDSLQGGPHLQKLWLGKIASQFYKQKIATTVEYTAETKDIKHINRKLASTVECTL